MKLPWWLVVLGVVLVAGGVGWIIHRERQVAAKILEKTQELRETADSLAVAREAKRQADSARAEALERASRAEGEALLLRARADAMRQKIDSLLGAPPTLITPSDSAAYWQQLYLLRTEEATDLRVANDSLAGVVAGLRVQMRMDSVAAARVRLAADSVIVKQAEQIRLLAKAAGSGGKFWRDAALGAAAAVALEVLIGTLDR